MKIQNTSTCNNKSRLFNFTHQQNKQQFYQIRDYSPVLACSRSNLQINDLDVQPTSYFRSNKSWLFNYFYCYLAFIRYVGWSWQYRIQWIICYASWVRPLVKSKRDGEIEHVMWDGCSAYQTSLIYFRFKYDRAVYWKFSTCALTPTCGIATVYLRISEIETRLMLTHFGLSIILKCFSL